MESAQFTNTGSCLITIGGTRFVPGDTGPKTTTIPSQETVDRWKRDLTTKLATKIRAELEAQKTQGDLDAKVKAELPKRLDAALDEQAKTTLAAVRAAPCVRARILVEGKASMPAAKPDPVQANQSLTTLEPLQAMAAIRLCTDLAVLNRWLESETRDAVKAAIIKRAEELAK